ncbi:hypothetical protein Tco_1547025 [Tanacetum coccineum]
MRELRRKLFKGTDDEDAHEHVQRFISDLARDHFPLRAGVTHDARNLRVFPNTHKGPAFRWINRHSSRLTSMRLLRSDYFTAARVRQSTSVDISHLITTLRSINYEHALYLRPPQLTTVLLIVDLNFNLMHDISTHYLPTSMKQDSSLFNTEILKLQSTYNDQTFSTNTLEKNIQIGEPNRRKAIMTTLQCLALSPPTSQYQDDEATTREQINDSPNNVDTKKPKENIHVIQASFKNCKGAHLTMEYPFEKEDKAVADSEWIWKFIENTDSNIRAIKTATENLKKTDQLTQTILTNTGEKVKEGTTIGKDYVKEPVPRNLPAQFLGNPYRTRETICAIRIPEEIKEDEGDMNDGCDITVEDEERLRKILTSPIHALPYLKPIGQPYMPLGLDYNKEKL